MVRIRLERVKELQEQWGWKRHANMILWKPQPCCSYIFLIRITPGDLCLLLLLFFFLPLFLYCLDLSQVSASMQCCEWTGFMQRWEGPSFGTYAAFYNSELVEILVEIQNTGSSMYQFGDRQGVLLSCWRNSVRRGKCSMNHSLQRDWISVV